ncbi:MAG: cupin domain-containing protein [Herpetosiphonaceae bacterium]|nr:cupin domain-containing protein [Herpetosiphonaceae bacterium]
MLQHDAQVKLNPSEEMIHLGSTQVRFLVTGTDSHSTIAMFEYTVPVGTKLAGPPHSHEGCEETIYGLEGVSTWTVNGARIDVGPGQGLCIPRGAVHGFGNQGTIDARVLFTQTPGLIGPEFFRESAEVIKAAGGGPPDRSKMAEIMGRYGITPAPPPTV